MLYRVARLAIAVPRLVIALAALVMLGTAIFGVPVTTLSAGGGLDAGAESSRASAVLSQTFGQGDMGMLITVTSGSGATGSRARAVGTEIVERLKNSPHVGQVQLAWTVPPSAARSFLGGDGRTGLMVATISGGETDAQRYAEELEAL